MAENSEQSNKEEQGKVYTESDGGETIDTNKKETPAERRRKRRKLRRENKKTYFGTDIILSSDFETGNGINFTKYDEDIYGFYPERDPGKLYSGQAFYFKFSVVF